jgi:hypothetical protein
LKWIKENEGQFLMSEFDVYSGIVSNLRTQARVSGGGGSINSYGGRVSGHIKEVTTNITTTFKVNNVPISWRADFGSGLEDGNYVNVICKRGTDRPLALHNASTNYAYRVTYSMSWRPLIDHLLGIFLPLVLFPVGLPVTLYFLFLLQRHIRRELEEKSDKQRAYEIAMEFKNKQGTSKTIFETY